jgi:hypothetical protein
MFLCEADQYPNFLAGTSRVHTEVMESLMSHCRQIIGKQFWIADRQAHHTFLLVTDHQQPTRSFLDQMQQEMQNSSQLELCA